MKAYKLIAVFLAVFAVMAQAATYVITGSGTSFTATKDGSTTISSNQPIQTVINAIKINANGEASVIQFGNGSVLDIGTAYIEFNGSGSPTWGTINLTGKITSAINDYDLGTIYLTNGASISSTADIGNTSVNAVYNNSTGTVSINGGTVSAQSIAVLNNSTGTVNINDGTVQATNNSYAAVYNSSSGTVNISGGTVSADYVAVYNWDDTGKVNISDGTVQTTGYCAILYGIVTISGGTVSATTGMAVYGTKTTVSGTANITSANTTNGTIVLYEATLEINGGTVANTANGNAVSYGTSSSILLTGDPTVTGTIMKTGTGVLSVDNNFNPSGNKTYELGFTNFDGVAVKEGASKIDNFHIAADASGITYGFETNGSDLIVVATNGYKVEVDGTTYTITKGTGKYLSIQNAIDYIKTQCSNSSCTIKFGNGEVLDIGDSYVSFNSWGTATIILTGKITSMKSANYTYGYNPGTILTNSSDVSITSTADITNTANGTAICQSSGTLNISGGTVSATTGRAIDHDYGALNIISGTVSATSGTAVYSRIGTLNISGGNVQATDNGKAVYIYGDGTVTINGGTVSATSGNAVENNSTSALNISNGTVSATTGRAIYNASRGAVNMSGGTVSATTGSAIFNGSTGAVSISGGTVQATSSGVAVYNTSSGTVIVNGGTVTGVKKYANSYSSGTIIAWDNPSGSKIYTAATNSDITILPATATAMWLNKDGKKGIDYTNGTNKGFIELSVTVNKAQITKPTATPLTYTGNEQSSIAENAVYTITGNKGTETGNYSATVTLNDKTNYEWADGTDTDLNLNWSIVKAKIAKPTATPLTYTGNEQSGIAENVVYNITGNSGTNVGSYTATVTLNDKNNYEWSDGTTADLSLPWSIAKAKITKPTVTNTALVYNSNEQSAGIVENAVYTITGDTKGKNAGSYTATVTLSDKANYEWSDGTTTDLTLPWSIAKADGLVNDAPVKRQISASNTETQTYNLTLLAFNKEKEDIGALSYELGTLTDGSSILAAAPTLDGTKTILSYKGAGKTTGTATQEITVTSENYATITVTITFEATAKMEVAITGITAKDDVYDGKPKLGYTGTPASGLYTGELLYEYAGTGHPQSTTPPTNAGDYTIKVSVPPDAPYIGVWSGTFTIEKATYDMSGIAFASKTVPYNGEPQSLAISGTLPTGVTVSYTGNGQTAIGVYTVTAVFTGDAANYNEIPSKTATLTINSKITPDMSGIAFASKTVPYNGEPQSITISGTLPTGVTVTYTGNGQTNAGEHTITATFAVADPASYNVPEAKTATLTITKATPATPSGLTAIEGQTLSSVTLPPDWSWATPTDLVGAAGTQTHKANYTPTNPNYIALSNVDVSVAVTADPLPIRPLQTASGILRVQAIGNAIVLQNLPGNAKVEVFNLQGKRVYSAIPENPRILRILVQTGVYVVKVDKQTVRVAVR